MRSVRQYWTGLRGRSVLNFNWDAIDHDSTVHVAAAEWRRDPGAPAQSPRVVGAANITVRNVTPHGPPFDPNHGVTFVVTVDWAEPLDVVTDIVVVDEETSPQPPELRWRRLAFAMQTQQQTNWCWCAVTVSVANFYGDALTQCGFANTALSRNDCCGMGGPGACNVTNEIVAPLNTAGHLGSWQASAPTFNQIRSEIDGGRPVSTHISWSGGGGHFVAVTGYLEGSSEFVAVQDPLGSSSDVRLSSFIASYQGVGTVDEAEFTTP
jgi:hypothetical protein